VHAQDRSKVEAALDQAQREGRSYAVEFRIVRPDGKVRRVFEQTDVERDDGGQVRVVRGIRRDVTEQSEAGERIRLLAYFDTLTGLANRALFHDQLRQWLPLAAANGLTSAVVVLDIDRFKLINETLSEQVGDAVLRTVADRLRQGLDAAHVQGLCREPVAGEHLARLGGNEFTILLADIGSPVLAEKVARGLLESLRTPIVVDSHELNVSASIGISLAPVNGTDTDTLLRNAISAMHAAKRDTLQRVCFYDGAMGAASGRRLSLESDLRRAVPQGQLQVLYQPKVETRDSRLVGAEALLRWEHPTRGVVGPNEFIPVAEESGLIVPITRWVIGDVCRQIAAWRAQGHATVPVSINLDATSLQNDGLVEVVQSALAEAGLSAAHIEFEVTESSLMRDHERASRTLHQLRDIGMRLSIDDFGTGYSSLTYLKRFPVNVLKIDRSFVQDLLTDASDAALTTAIIAMAKSLNLSLVAEGVETWEQADFLALRGCHTVQGYLFAKPLPAASFAALLRDGLSTRRPPTDAPVA
jgi:diguanylate cyclase (GGDEF)-like protein